jgi:hypothetical protein
LIVIRFERYKQLHDHLNRKSSIYESQELKIQIADEQTSDYNGSLNGSNDLPSLKNATTGELKEGVVSAFTNPAFTPDEETTVKLSLSEEEAQQSLDDLTDRLDAEDTNAMPVDSYNPSESELEVEIRPDYGPPNDYINVPLSFEETSALGHDGVSKPMDVPEDYPVDGKTEADENVVEENENEETDDKDEPNPDYDVKAVRFSTQVLDAGENKFQPLKEKEDVLDKKNDEGEEKTDNEAEREDEETARSEENVDDVQEDFGRGKEADFGDGIENERTDEEILSPNEILNDDNDFEDDSIPHFTFDTKL